MVTAGEDGRNGDSLESNCQSSDTLVSRMKLPGGDRAVVEVAKLRDYCLNPAHPRGRHKARVFASVLGLGAGDASFLREQLLRAAREGEATAGKADEYGARYWIDCEVTRAGRSGTVRSAWLVPAGDQTPRLVTCYVVLE